MKQAAKISDYWNSEVIHTLFSSSNIGFIIVAPDHYLLDASPLICRKLGYSLEQLLQMKITDLTHPEDLTMTSNLLQLAEGANLTRTFEKRYLTREGRTLWCKLRSEAVHDEDGRLKFRIAMVEDITREKLAEIELEQMAAITEASEDAIFRSDTRGIIQFWSKGAEHMYGYTAAEAIGKNASILKADQSDTSMRDAWEKLGRGEIVRTPEVLARHKNGRPIEVSVLIFPIRDKEGQVMGYAAVHRDISAIKQLEVQFHHAQRLETAGLLAGGIAHDFNNILTVVQGACELLRMDTPPGTLQGEHLKLIERSADKATRLTRQLLAFSRKQKISPVVIDPKTLIGDIGTLLKRALGDEIMFDTELHSTWSIREDATQLEQVMLNLAINARHAMPQGGRFSVSTEDVELGELILPEPEGKFRHTPNQIRPGAYVLITVNDSGCGMDKAVLEKIFDPFFTTKSKDQGTGLGLSVVYGMVTQVGGGISVLSEPGIGTSFQIYLPRVEESDSQPEPLKPQGRLESEGGRIMVLEDDNGVRKLTVALLEDAGYTVTEAATPREILDGRVDCNVDLIISDIMMPEMNGPEFAELWTRDHPDARFLFMSGYFEDPAFAEKMRDKLMLQKPFKPAILLDAVSQILNSGD